MELIANQSKGIQTAWLLSTLGSKASSRGKIIRKDDLLKISIPDLCTELIEYHHRDGSEVNIRFSSNVLHGISILYGSKTAQVLSEVTQVQLRLQSSFLYMATRPNDQLVKRGRANSLKRSEVLGNDQAFQVGWDLMPQSQLSGLGFDVDDDDEPEVKRRKLEIAEFDLREFSIFDSTTGVDTGCITGLGHFALAIDRQTDANFENVELSMHVDNNKNNNNSDDDHDHVNLQFNEDGQILETEELEPGIDHISSVDIEVEHSRRGVDLWQITELSQQEDNDDVNATLHDLSFQQEDGLEGRGTNLQPTTRRSFRVPKRKLVTDENISLTRDFIINHHDNYTTIMNYRAFNVPFGRGRQLQQVYQSLNSTRFRPWVNGSSVRNFNSSSIEETINRTMGIRHRTEIMAHEASEQARNSQVLMEMERSRMLPSDDDLSHDLDQVDLRGVENDETNFDAAMLDLDFDLDGSRGEGDGKNDDDKDDDDDEDDDDSFHQSSSFSLSSDGENLQPHLIPRLKKLVKYFVQRSVELGKAADSQEESYHLTFKELVPVRYNNEANTKRIAAGAFSSVLFLTNKNIVSIDVKSDTSTTNELFLSKSNDIHLTLYRTIK
ncbi:hypothetical protein KGF57_001692 [Candida theae]|uniref:Rad21/Rec8-like protein N-terminal domain-containing protein n=1 Tax=Candida theae TaxID=1198502 RepID=A0AAD5FZK5_9ASCO|nr:uncharacterized protein KGF57_001692 [Candida theae]KAI5961567.1 hypothetical protein KGF57_001692 [Candida theae]